jgi:large subunit ribosomal protein L15
LKQNELKPAPGSRHKSKRVGRGDASGHGSFSGHGQKGQKARSGGGVRPGFEGGQLPLSKRLPQKRGFANIYSINYSIVNVGRLSLFEPGTEVTPERLVVAGIIKNVSYPVKMLGDGELKNPLTVKAHKFSDKARNKIEAVGGKVEVLV